MHLFHDVAATHELTLDVDLGDGWPVREVLDGLTQGLIGKHIEVLEIDTVGVHQDHDEATKTALGLLFCAFHKNYDIVLCYPLLDMCFALFRVCEGLLLLGLEVRVGLFLCAEASELGWHKQTSRLVHSDCCTHKSEGLGRLVSCDGPKYLLC